MVFRSSESMYKFFKDRFPISWFYSFPVHIPNWVFKARYLGAYVSFTVSEACVPDVAFESLIHLEKVCTFEIPLDCELLYLGVGFSLVSLYLHLPYWSLVFFEPFCGSFIHPAFQVPFSGNYFICNCRSVECVCVRRWVQDLPALSSWTLPTYLLT